MIQRFALLSALTICAFSGSALAAQNWMISPEQSHLTFSGHQGDSPFTGEFKTFTPIVAFDKNDLKSSHIKVIINTGSASIQGVSGGENLPTAAWLNVTQFPEAVFESTEITSTGNDTYQVNGTLTILGVTKDISLPFSLKEIDGMTQASGKVTLKRLDFGIGKSVDPNGKTISDDVDVKFDLIARPTPK